MQDEIGLHRYLSAKQAAQRMGVSLSFFRAKIAPSIQCVDLARMGARKRLPRWSVTDLDEWADRRRVA